jgi:hypothetical protein
VAANASLNKLKKIGFSPQDNIRKLITITAAAATVQPTCKMCEGVHCLVTWKNFNIASAEDRRIFIKDRSMYCVCFSLQYVPCQYDVIADVFGWHHLLFITH